MSGIFEIREYLSNDGKIEKHDMVDISKEMEFISKMCDSGVDSPGDINEDELFIRELALLSEGKDPTCNTDEEISYFSEEALNNNVSFDASNSSTVANTSQGSNKNASQNTNDTTAKARTGNSGWGKGFLQRKPKTKTASVISKVNVAPSEELEKLAISSTTAPVGSNSTPQQTTTQPEHMSTAFSGGIFERTPLPVPSGSVQRSTGTYLGPKKKG